jgi:hypothetical protein
MPAIPMPPRALSTLAGLVCLTGALAWYAALMRARAALGVICGQAHVGVAHCPEFYVAVGLEVASAAVINNANIRRAAAGGAQLRRLSATLLPSALSCVQA